jgi:hypothetical protein
VEVWSNHRLHNRTPRNYSSLGDPRSSLEPDDTSSKVLRMAKKLVKWVALLLGGLVLFLFVAAKFGTYAERYECKGVFNYSDGREVPQTIYVRITHYRWFLFWTGDGNLWAETSNGLSNYYPLIRESDDEVYIYSDNGDQKGRFSRLSNALTLGSATGVFHGVCAKISR